ncbi:vWA domain-containing protein [Rufibacter latericius]|uniref:VWA domain-containing protein n=1 Tax=Rufibacter latericius TaxID=2487040 RepID=A0A3M9MVZ6_9BACT|nr:VWA domain-containing protein [Rufibacter latericius]RNI29345.1 VWA domain-containing protein [Rufibacter latericius]
MRSVCLWLICLLLGGLLALPATAQNRPAPPPKKTRLLFLLDASGSMQAKWETSQRWAVAKTMLTRMVDSLDSYANLEIALRVYGHQTPVNLKNCKDTKLEVPFAAHNAGNIKKKLQQITPKGNTPITYSLEQSANDFPQDPNSRNVIVIITDGLESCGGDPCATSLALQKKRVFLKPFIIGLGDDPGYAQQFGCMGQYYNASDIKTFQKVLENVINITLKKTTVSVELTDEGGRSVETNVNLTFLNSVTDQPEYNYVHYLDNAGKPDELEIDALLSYDLVVNTIPAVKVRNLDIKPGRHNVFKVKAPQGYLYLRQDAPTSYGYVTALVRAKGDQNLLQTQRFPSQQKYLTGSYEVELLTLPRIKKTVTIRQGQATEVTFAPPGSLNITQDLQGYGSLYLLNNDGTQDWIWNLPEGSSKISVPLQPGNYRLVYRIKSAKGSKFTDVKNFSIKSNLTTTIKLFN